MPRRWKPDAVGLILEPQVIRTHLVHIRVAPRSEATQALRYQWQCSCSRVGEPKTSALAARIGGRRHQAEQEKTRP